MYRRYRQGLPRLVACDGSSGRLALVPCSAVRAALTAALALDALQEGLAPAHEREVPESERCKLGRDAAAPPNVW